MPANLTLTQQSDGNYAANLVGDDYTLDVPDATLTVIPYTPPVVAPIDPPVAPPTNTPVTPPASPPAQPDPVANLSVTVRANRAVTVQDQSQNVPDGSALEVVFGDSHGRSSIRLGNTCSYAYTADGTYTVTETIKTPDGKTYTATHDVTVPA